MQRDDRSQAGAMFRTLGAWGPIAKVKLRFADVFACEQDWRWCSGVLQRPDLWYVVDGVGWLHDERDQDGRKAIRSGDLVLMRAQRSYVAGHDPRRPLTLIAAHFDLLDWSGAPIPLGAPQTGISVLHAEAGAFIQEMLVRSVRCLQDGQGSWAEAWFQTVIMEIIDQCVRSWPSGRFGDQVRRIEQICERIRRRPGDPFRVESLAGELGVSPEHFSRLFRQVRGVPPREFITRTRMDAARRLLLTSSHSIERIAMLLGYDSAFQFSRHFKIRTGVSPSRFRDRRP